MPAWNAAAFIGPVLDSLAAQTYPNLHVLISVDVGSDDTAALCEAFAAAHERVTVARQPKRLGWIGNANALLRMADGEYVFFAFHDDPVARDYVERLVDALEHRPAAVLAYSDVRSNIGPFTYDDLLGSRFERARRIMLQQGPWWVPNRGLMRASVVKVLGGMHPHLAGEYSADLPWLLRLALRGEFIRVPAPLVTKSFRRDSLSAGWKKGAFRRIAVILACCEVIRSSDLRWLEKLRLLIQAAWFAFGVEAWYLKRQLGLQKARTFL
jgi:glycosyltransferase involved in cell wall biosynthesis